MSSLIENACEKQFHLSKFGTTVSTEIIAGLTTFATMAGKSAFDSLTALSTAFPLGRLA